MGVSSSQQMSSRRFCRPVMCQHRAIPMFTLHQIPQQHRSPLVYHRLPLQLLLLLALERHTLPRRMILANQSLRLSLSALIAKLRSTIWTTVALHLLLVPPSVSKRPVRCIPCRQTRHAKISSAESLLD